MIRSYQKGHLSFGWQLCNIQEMLERYRLQKSTPFYHFLREISEFEVKSNLLEKIIVSTFTNPLCQPCKIVSEMELAVITRAAHRNLPRWLKYGSCILNIATLYIPVTDEDMKNFTRLLRETK